MLLQENNRGSTGSSSSRNSANSSCSDASPVAAAAAAPPRRAADIRDIHLRDATDAGVEHLVMLSSLQASAASCACAALGIDHALQTEIWNAGNLLYHV